jgi:hypothetical protein
MQNTTHYITGTATKYITEHLRSKGFSVTVSAWMPGQLYVVSDSPKTIAASIPTSHTLSVKEYLHVREEDREEVERSSIKLPNPTWVRIKDGKYKGDIGYVFDSDQLNLFVAVLIPPRDFPYPMPRGSALFDRSRLPEDKAGSDIIRDEEVVGCSYQGERYYMGLLLKKFHRYLLELVAFPHADDIRLHLQSGWDRPFIKQTLIAFSMQFLRVGDAVSFVTTKGCSQLCTVVSIDHAFGSVGLEYTTDGHRTEMDIRLQEVTRVFRLGDTVRVVAGSYFGLEGYITQMDKEIFHVCQDVTMEEVNVRQFFKTI